MEAKHIRATVILPPDLHARLQALAQRERRSLHGQILRLLEEGLERDQAQQARRRRPPAD